MFIARLGLEHAAAQPKSVALGCGDLRKAYYSALVELVVGPLPTAGERQTVLVQPSMGIA